MQPFPRTLFAIMTAVTAEGNTTPPPAGTPPPPRQAGRTFSDLRSWDVDDHAVWVDEDG